ncbi:MAG: hypothetical protein WA213_20905 [Terriglobales bacterium]
MNKFWKIEFLLAEARAHPHLREDFIRLAREWAAKEGVNIANVRGAEILEEAAK